jgi:hypothetical protein
LNNPAIWGNIDYCSDGMHEVNNAGPTGPAYRSFFNPDIQEMVLYEQDFLDDLCQGTVVKCNHEGKLVIRTATG